MNPQLVPVSLSSSPFDLGSGSWHTSPSLWVCMEQLFGIWSSTKTFHYFALTQLHYPKVARVRGVDLLCGHCARETWQFLLETRLLRVCVCVCVRAYLNSTRLEVGKLSIWGSSKPWREMWLALGSKSSCLPRQWLRKFSINLRGSMKILATKHVSLCNKR